MLVTITPIPLPIRKKSTSRVTLRKNGRAIMLSGPEAALWEKEDQLWKLLKEGLKPQLISLCTEHKVDATGTMPEMRGRIAPELKRKGLLSRCTEEQIAELINKK